MRGLNLKKLLISIVSIIALVLIIYTNFFNKNIKNTSIFSWSTSVIKDNDLDNMYKLIDKLNIDTIYQNLHGLDKEEIEKFIGDIRNNTSADVYYLAGDPSWYNNSKAVRDNLDLVNSYNNNVSENLRINAVVLDIEPWTMGDDWDRDDYKKTLEDTYSYCKSLHLGLISVIPFWLDEDILESIIINSDEIAVMNYNIDNTIKNIKEEIELSKIYNKRINVVAEVQEPNEKYGVLNNTTYYNMGYEALMKDWNEIYKTYNYDNIYFSYHDYKNIFKFIDM